MTSTLNFYKPQKQKSGGGNISIPGSEVLGSAPTGKMQNPLPGTERGDPWDPDGVIRGRAHNGIDLSSGGNAKVLAAASGKVIDMLNTCPVASTPEERECGGGFGCLVYIEHDGEWAGYTTRYAHLKTGSVTVQIGQQVQKGQVIGLEGNTGASGGEHLHFEVVKGGQRLEPEQFFCPPATGTYGRAAHYPLRSKC
jgi:murein DD-endopeptidase MepM/ murein hydrolase activator NlpD